MGPRTRTRVRSTSVVDGSVMGRSVLPTGGRFGRTVGRAIARRAFECRLLARGPPTWRYSLPAFRAGGFRHSSCFRRRWSRRPDRRGTRCPVRTVVARSHRVNGFRRDSDVLRRVGRHSAWCDTVRGELSAGDREGPVHRAGTSKGSTNPVPVEEACPPRVRPRLTATRPATGSRRATTGCRPTTVPTTVTPATVRSGVAETDRVLMDLDYDVSRSHRIRRIGGGGEKAKEYWVGDRTQF